MIFIIKDNIGQFWIPWNSWITILCFIALTSYNFISQPLVGNSVNALNDKIFVLTREHSQSKDTISILNHQGGTVISLPTIAISDIAISSEVLTDIKNNVYDAVILTSINAVNSFLGQLRINNILFRGLILTFGTESQKRISELGYSAQIIENTNSSKELAFALVENKYNNLNFLFPCAKNGRKELVDILKTNSIKIQTAAVYENLLPDKSKLEAEINYILNNKIDCYIFSSPSTYINFLQLCDIDDPIDFFNSSAIAAIGKTTSHTIKSSGVSVQIVPDSPTMTNLVNSIINYYENSRLLWN